MALKQVSALPPETQKELCANFPLKMCADKLNLLSKAKKELEAHVTLKFCDAFD